MIIKRIANIILALLLSLNLFIFGGCNKKDNQTDKENKVMQISLNPEVEFILDGNDKVITVNALNEEGNLIISSDVFDKIEGKTADEATKLFIQVSKETGYLVTGNIKDGENEINISISGDVKNAAELYNDIKTDIEVYLESLGLQAKLTELENISKEHLEEALDLCAPYFEEAKIKAMTHQELVQELIASRKETAKMYSQEIKKAYYEAKMFALEQAKMEALKTHLSDADKIIFNSANKIYKQVIDQIESIRYQWLIKDTGIYQTALTFLREKKIEFLKYRNEIASKEEVTIEMTEHLNTLETALETAETNLIAQGEIANEKIDNLKKSIETEYNKILDLFKNMSLTDCAEEISAKQTEFLNDFFTAFESDYLEAQELAKVHWNEMENELIGNENNKITITGSETIN